MIEDDHVEPPLPGESDVGMVAAAAVDHDQEVDAGLGQGRYGRGVQAVALGARRHARDDAVARAGGPPQRPEQERRGGHPVDVVVAVDTDPLVVRQRTADPLNGCRHVR